MQQRVRKLKARFCAWSGRRASARPRWASRLHVRPNRKFIRMALGGVRDEAEIRGHRRTYIGAMPGKIVQNLTKAGYQESVLPARRDRQDGDGFRGDPASALLEVLDPEQNHTFQDHYLEVDFDLSGGDVRRDRQQHEHPPALLDRMEVIRLSGYTGRREGQHRGELSGPNRFRTTG